MRGAYAPGDEAVREAGVMPVVLLCPSAPGEDPPPWITPLESTLDGISSHLVVIPAKPTDAADDAAWIAYTALAASEVLSDIDSPVVAVLTGGATTLAPALGFALNASGHPPTAYVLVDGELPAVSDHDGGWPTAPVIVVAASDSDVSLQARLRSWQVSPHAIDAIRTAIGEQ